MSAGNGYHSDEAETAVRSNLMLTCIESFEAAYDDDRVQLVAGRDRIGADHELAKRFPRHFRISEGNGLGGRGEQRAVVDRMRDPVRESLERELSIRARRLAELDQRAERRPAPASASDAFWRGVERLLADPKREREEAESERLLDELAAARAKSLREETENLSEWLDR